MRLWIRQDLKKRLSPLQPESGLQCAACGRQSRLHGLASLAQPKAPFPRAVPRTGTRDSDGPRAPQVPEQACPSKRHCPCPRRRPRDRARSGPLPRQGRAQRSPWRPRAGRSLTHRHGLGPATPCWPSTALCAPMEASGAEDSTQSVLLLLVAGQRTTIPALLSAASPAGLNGQWRSRRGYNKRGRWRSGPAGGAEAEAEKRRSGGGAEAEKGRWWRCHGGEGAERWRWHGGEGAERGPEGAAAAGAAALCAGARRGTRAGAPARQLLPCYSCAHRSFSVRNRGFCLVLTAHIKGSGSCRALPCCSSWSKKD